MSTSNYSEPAVRLLTIGTPSGRGQLEWPDYPALYGLSAADAPELIRMATDEDIYYADAEDDSVYGYIHAWRALAQLGAEEAIRPLLTLLHHIDDDDDDWIGEELPDALAMFGPAAVPALTEYLAYPANKMWARLGAKESLDIIGNQFPQARETILPTIAEVLEHYSTNDPVINAEMAYSLGKFKAVEHAPLVEKAYKARMIDDTIFGDWEDFQVLAGMLEKRITEKKPGWNRAYTPPTKSPETRALSTEESKIPSPEKSSQKKEKNKRKQEKQSRKKNRKKK